MNLKKANSLLVYLSQKAKYAHVFGFPRVILIEPTNYCNAGCPLCPTGAGTLKRKKGYMDFSVYKKIIDEVAPFSKTIILWNYGEPFLHPKVYEMISYAREKGLFVLSSTNGYAFYSEKQVDKLLESNIDQLIVSFDGVTEKIFNQYRRNVQFEKLMKGLKYYSKKLRERKEIQTKVDLQFIIMKQNEHQQERAKKIAKLLKFNYVPKKVNVYMSGAGNPLDWLPKDQEKSHYTVKGKQIKQKRGIIKNEICEIWDSIVINWDGSINPCCHDYQGEVVLGSVKDKPLMSTWNSHQMVDLRRNVIAGRDRVKICKTCPIVKSNLEHFI